MKTYRQREKQGSKVQESTKGPDEAKIKVKMWLRELQYLMQKSKSDCSLIPWSSDKEGKICLLFYKHCLYKFCLVQDGTGSHYVAQSDRELTVEPRLVPNSR